MRKHRIGQFRAGKMIALMTAAALLLSGCGSAAETARTEESTAVATEAEIEEAIAEATEAVTEEIAVVQEEIAAATEEITAATTEAATEIAQATEGTTKTAPAAGFETAAEATEHMAVGWNLGNSMDATGTWIPTSTDGTIEDFQKAWGNPLTPQSLFPRLKELGFTTVRIPITWNYHFDDAGNIDEAWMARVQELVDWGLNAGLYVIINIHHDTGADGWLRASTANYEKNKDLYAHLWEQIATRFEDYPETLLFEGFNEMLDTNNEWNNPGDDAVNAVNSYNQIFVTTVRATGGYNGERNLICNTYAAATTGKCLSGYVLPVDSVADHLMCEVHCYVPYEFITDEGITWTSPISVYNDYVAGQVDAYFDRVEKDLTSRGIPVLVGEFATDDKHNTADRAKWYGKVVSRAKAIGAGAIVWDNGHTYNMGHIDRLGTEDDFPEIIQACMDAWYGEGQR